MTTEMVWQTTREQQRLTALDRVSETRRQYAAQNSRSHRVHYVAPNYVGTTWRTGYR
jgi:hypothetical protein